MSAASGERQWFPRHTVSSRRGRAVIGRPRGEDGPELVGDAPGVRLREVLVERESQDLAAQALGDRQRPVPRGEGRLCVVGLADHMHCASERLWSSLSTEERDEAKGAKGV
ncbi:hypothetical protein PS467_25790 [Streptomyces luomodiensis]|uniref:Uncharacterized protein n=1 Tax=Streptomyces luomodiensis TaxID=3026192 RepID=A0ABY9V172_9ACTN|nr:hypothetical protein [Streptomyces sp. SCA4-21]WNE98498.1 hypothetical protein PS467_25790 [Streptomyces sp. SCA4-21]